MKAGIVTIPDSTNFGNRLQNYALSQILRTRFGCQAVTLAAREEKSFENGAHLLWLKNQIARLLCVFPTLAERRFGPGITRWANFQSWNRRIPTRNFYECPRLPSELNREFDLFLAGSDQIWNYHFASKRFDDYFLTFAEDKKKAAVSGSFGVEEIPAEWQQYYAEALSKFPHISVREYPGQAIVKRLTGREVPVLVDPTMVLTPEEWEKAAKKPRVDCRRPYVLKYCLGGREGADPIDHWAVAHGYAVYTLLDETVPELYSAGPGEFLTLLRHAGLVWSDSFHAIAFSILFSRPFVVCPRRGKEDYMTSRLTTLLDKFGFQHRWEAQLTPEEYLSCDFSHVPPLLEAERQKFLDYLRHVLRGETHAD